jgi:hypothetical protein
VTSVTRAADNRAPRIVCKLTETHYKIILFVGIKEVRKYNIRLKAIKIQHFVVLSSAITTAIAIISIESEFRAPLLVIKETRNIL